MFGEREEVGLITGIKAELVVVRGSCGKADFISPSDPREEVGTFGVLRVYSAFRLPLTSLVHCVALIEVGVVSGGVWF